MKTATTLILAFLLAFNSAKADSGPNTQRGTVLGGAIGAAAGAIIGNNSGEGSGKGALIGAAVGGIAGSILGNAKDHEEGTIYSTVPTHVVGPWSSEPMIQYDEYTYIWIDPHWKTNRAGFTVWVPGHWERVRIRVRPEFPRQRLYPRTHRR